MFLARRSSRGRHAGAARTGRVCATFHQAGVAYHPETLGAGWTCASVKSWIVKLIGVRVTFAGKNVPLKNGPAGPHCIADASLRGHVSSGAASRGRSRSQAPASPGPTGSAMRIALATVVLALSAWLAASRSNAAPNGWVRGGHVVVKDDYSTATMHGALTYNGGSSSTIPVLAELVFDRVACQYVFQAGFAVDDATYNGDAPLRPVTRLGAGATSERYHIPANLHLNGGDGPEAGGPGCDNPIVNDKSCYSFSGGWSTDFATLFKCNSLSPESSGCASSDTSVGTATFTWSLTPTYAK